MASKVVVAGHLRTIFDMTLISAMRPKARFSRRSRRHTIIDANADITTLRSTGDPRLDLARAINRAAGR